MLQHDLFYIICLKSEYKIFLFLVLNSFRNVPAEDALYQLPDNLKVESSTKKSEDMLSNQMLSGIPEVDLGIE